MQSIVVLRPGGGGLAVEQHELGSALSGMGVPFGRKPSSPGAEKHPEASTRYDRHRVRNAVVVRDQNRHVGERTAGLCGDRVRYGRAHERCAVVQQAIDGLHHARDVAQSILTTDFGAWYGRSSLIAVLLVSALAIWACRASVGNRPLLSPRGARLRDHPEERDVKTRNGNARRGRQGDSPSLDVSVRSARSWLTPRLTAHSP
jgi:hypothetical protein